MPRLKLTIAYVGTQYHGWQTQALKNASPLPTIQNIIEDAVAHVLGERVHVHGAGRTDAGVHAEAQVAHPATRSTAPSARPTNTASGFPSVTRRRSSSLSSGPAALWMWGVWTRGAGTSLANGTLPA